MPEPLKIGFLGAGSRAFSLFDNLIFDKENGEKVYPQAAFDIDPKIVDNWKMKCDSVHTDLDEFLSQDLDAVVIGTPPITHANFAIQCLQREIDVWSEVPMGLNMDELNGIIDAQKSNKGVKGKFAFGENYCYMLQPQFATMKVQQNKLGKIYYAEGEYTHSVEHYMIVENFLYNQELDPELHPETKPTWRSNLNPITYGHAFGPAYYAINGGFVGDIERPVEVTAMGNMKMQKRFNTDNFQIAMVKTDQDTIIKFVIGFVLGHHGRIFYSFWGSQGLFMGGSYQTDMHYYYEVPDDQAAFPYRHQQTPQILSDQDLMDLGAPHAEGGHGGGDRIMFRRWVESMWNKQNPEIDAFRAAEMTAPGILAVEAMHEKRAVEIPRFE
jgi:hypothetical protein